MVVAHTRRLLPTRGRCCDEHLIILQNLSYSTSREESGCAGLLASQKTFVSLSSQFSAITASSAGQSSSHMSRQLAQEKVEEKEIWVVVTKQIEHSVH